MILSCPTHGRFEAYEALVGHSQIVHLCPGCADDKVNAEVRIREERNAHRLRVSRLKEMQSVAQLPKRFADVSLDDYQIKNEGQRTAQAMCFAYAKTWPEQVEKGGSLLLLGPCETGKTMLACGVVNSVMAEFMSAATFGTVSDYCREVRSTYGSNRAGKSEAQIIQDLRRVDLAVLDDVGASTEGAHDLRVLFDIVDGRWRDGRPMIVTSNLTLADLHRHLGDRFMKRFRNGGAWTVVAFDFDGFNGRQGALL